MCHKSTCKNKITANKDSHTLNQNRPECAEILLDAQADPNIKDEYNVEPLHYAASSVSNLN